MPRRSDGLTERDREMLRMLAQGLTNEQIGEALNLSPITVKHRLEAVADRLGLERRQRGVLGAALVAWAWRNLGCR